MMILIRSVFAFIAHYNNNNLHAKYAEDPPGNLTDLNICKVSHLGLEYIGHVGKTESSIRCQSWAASNPHEIKEYIKNENFADGSKKLAKNYCRNPTKDPMGPWCYTMDLDLQFETCSIPLCKFSQCKITGPGIEYAGEHNKGTSERNCLKWNKKRNRVKELGKYTSRPKFNPILFPEQHLGDAKRFCRNPTGDVGGPWCFIENEDTNEIEKEYCDIPFCDDPDCMVFTKNSDTYMHYTDFNDTLTKFSFGVKLWDSDSYPEASARLLLTLIPLPFTGQEIQDAGLGLEISIGNNYSALRFGNKDEPEYEETRGILKSTSYTMFSLSWHQGFITFGLEGKAKPIFLAEYVTKKNLLGIKMNKFNYYSAQGTNILWYFPFCKDDFECDAHTTTGKEFQQFWPLRQKGTGYDLYVYIRAFHSASVLFVLSPVLDYPYVKFSLSDKNNQTRITVVEEYEGSEKDLKVMKLGSILDYWQWREFSISFFANTMTIYVEKPLGLQLLAEVTHEIFRNVRWFSVSSENVVAHWSFYCIPPPWANPPQAYLPECALNAQETNYKGTQDVTNTGLPCVPWSATKLIGKKIKFSNNSALDVWNYCRDPDQLNEGSYCYTVSLDPEKNIEKNFCNIRKCKSEQCRMAGTGNDYSGTLSKSRSNRTCLPWVPSTSEGALEKREFSSEIVTEQTLVEATRRGSWNDSLFPEVSAAKAKNYCRNPSRNMAGSWCYTTDPKVSEDACNVKDCDKPEECTIITNSVIPGRLVYILPQWKESGYQGGLRFSLKEWNPDEMDGINFLITPKYATNSINLQIAAEYNEKIRLFKDGELVEEKRMPHLIGSGKWTDFWLQIRRGEIMLGLEGVPTALFEWSSSDKQYDFEPMFLSYTSIFGRPMGISFICKECQTQNTTVYDIKHYYPIGLWADEKSVFNNFILKARSTGIIEIPLMRLLEYHSYFLLVLDNDHSEIYLLNVDNWKNRTLLQTKNVTKVLTANSWTEYDITFNEFLITVKKDHIDVLQYVSSTPLLMYWFSIAPQTGWITWTVNCDPVDLDGPPRDGGWSHWSPWICTVPCGGGEGYRTRTCSNPRPNILGKLCHGSPTSTGKCNQFTCGDINPDTLEKIRENLQKESLSYIVQEGSNQIIKNDRELLKIIARDSPKAYYEWTLNGIFIKPETERVVFKRDNIHIKYVLPRDTGLYVCMLFRVNQIKVILRVVSLAVISKRYDHEIRATKPFTLKCNSVILGYVYTDLNLKLILNDKLYFDHGTTTLAAVNTYFIKSLKTEHSGHWKCLVEQKDLGLSWVTNYVKINVKKAPNILTHLMEDEVTKPLFGWMKSETMVFFTLIFIITFVIFMVIVFLIVYKKHCILRTSRYNRI